MIVNYTIKMHFHLLSFFLLLSTLGKPTSKDSMIIWECGGGKRTKRKDTLKKKPCNYQPVSCDSNSTAQ